MSKTTSLIKTIERAVIHRLVTARGDADKKNDEERRAHRFATAHNYVRPFELFEAVKTVVVMSGESELFTTEIFNRTLNQMQRVGIVEFVNADGGYNNPSLRITNEAWEKYKP